MPDGALKEGDISLRSMRAEFEAALLGGVEVFEVTLARFARVLARRLLSVDYVKRVLMRLSFCLLYTSDAADE